MTSDWLLQLVHHKLTAHPDLVGSELKLEEYQEHAEQLITATLYQHKANILNPTLAFGDVILGLAADGTIRAHTLGTQRWITLRNIGEDIDEDDLYLLAKKCFLPFVH